VGTTKIITMNKKVSFDFDSTLDHKILQDYAKELIERDFEVWVVTTRNHALFVDVKEVTDRLKIPSWRVIFTSGSDKWLFFKDWRDDPFIWHIDDDFHECKCINRKESFATKAIEFWNNPSWKEECERIITEFKI
jgi:hypothetical protein